MTPQGVVGRPKGRDAAPRPQGSARVSACPRPAADPHAGHGSQDGESRQERQDDRRDPRPVLAPEPQDRLGIGLEDLLHQRTPVGPLNYGTGDGRGQATGAAGRGRRTADAPPLRRILSAARAFPQVRPFGGHVDTGDGEDAPIVPGGGGISEQLAHRPHQPIRLGVRDRPVRVDGVPKKDQVAARSLRPVQGQRPPGPRRRS